MPAGSSLVGLVLVALVTSLIPVHAFYLPGAAPHDYREGEKVDLFVNALTPGPDDTKLIQMLKDNATWKFLCMSTVPTEDAKFINDRIMEDYALNWLVDGLPAATMMIEMKSGELFFNMGFNLGWDLGPSEEHPRLHNHYDIVLRYHSFGPGQNRIVGVIVWPSRGLLDCNSGVPPLILSETGDNCVRYTYRVIREKSSTPWASRWDNYLHIFNWRTHLFSLINSLVIVAFLCAMVSVIVYRSVLRDISRYNVIDRSEDVQEDWGWKLVHGEVFRTPKNPLILSTFVGNGAQLCTMVGFTLVFALLGFLSPSIRGSFATVMMICWTFFGSVRGYVSSRVYASLGGTERRENAFITATALPAIIFMIVFLLNLLLIKANSSAAMPFGTMLLIVLLWFGISAPLSAIGAYFGARRGAISHPVSVNPIPRQIPPPPRYLRPWATTLLGGILPFGATLVELYFVLSSLFASRAYYAYGFLALAAGVVGLTTATVTILFTYFVLCAEEYRWHWRAFLTGGGNAIWLLAYGIFYLVSRLSLDSFSSVALYFGYLFLFAIFDFLVTGTIGFLATYWAIRKLYGSVRID
ncbi:endosomal P24A protein [Lactarius sanguifluus]|nr:endosomal P24A protein [Lactarius sanguifluus]